MSKQTPHTPDRYTNTVLLGPIVVAFWFLDSFAFRYLTVDRDRFGIYWAHRGWLFVHIIAGMVALMSGYILYTTSNVLHHYRTDQHVAAALVSVYGFLALPVSSLALQGAAAIGLR